MPIINNANSIFQTGINISAVEIGPSNTGDPYVVDADGSVISTNGRGIFLNGASETYVVTVNGVVSGLGAGFDGIRMVDGASTATISVGALGRVAGARHGISLEGGGTITNAGLISGTTDAGILHVSGDVSIINSGTIRSGAQGGIHFTGTGTHTINNSGSIIAGSSGFAIGSFGDSVENLTNSGTITGNIELNFGNDVVNNTGTITGTVFLGNGADTYVGSSGVDIVQGGNDADILSGAGGDDQLTGGAGFDQLNGGTGTNTLTGGLDSDDYYIFSQSDIIVEVAGEGTGDGVLADVSFTLAADDDIEQMVAIDLAGTSAINLTGNALAQTLIGNAGNNVLNGGVDLLVDTLIGLGGNDTYVLGASTNDTVTDTAGIDKIESSITRSLASFATIENLTLTGGSVINGTGNALANTIKGNGAANILNGGLGKDILTGGLGNDAFVFNTAPNVTTNRDTITDFNVVNDTIRLENAIFNKLVGANNTTLSAAQFFKGTAAHDLDDRIIYNSATGALFYDADGNKAGGVAAIQFATLTTHPTTVTNADFFII